MRRHLALCAVLAVLTGCSSPHAAEKASSPAIVANTVKETDFASVTLTSEAEARLAVRTAAVEDHELRRTRVMGGEMVAPPGQAVTVTAPLAGTVLAPDGRDVPASGAHVGRGEVVLRLRPLPNAGDLAAALERLEVARIRVRRAEQLLEAGAKSVRDVENARAELVAAESAAKALAPTGDAGDGGVVALASPLDGVMGTLRVAPGQAVAAATPLFDVGPHNDLWVRVPIYVGELAAVDASKGAIVRPLGSPAGTREREGRAVTGPPTADPSAVTGDLFFSVSNRGGALRPGERVEVELRLREAETARVVPWSAVVYDVNGGTWVYESTAPHVFTRRRVQVKRVEGDLAVLAGGPPAGTQVVSQGAAELFGTELGNGR